MITYPHPWLMFLSGWGLEASDDALAAPQAGVELPRVQRLDVGHLVGHHLGDISGNIDRLSHITPLPEGSRY